MMKNKFLKIVALRVVQRYVGCTLTASRSSLINRALAAVMQPWKVW